MQHLLLYIDYLYNEYYLHYNSDTAAGAEFWNSRRSDQL